MTDPASEIEKRSKFLSSFSGGVSLAQGRALRSRQGAVSNRRRTSWSAGPRQTSLPSIVANGAFLWAAGAQANLDGLTVVRIRGQVGLWLEVVTGIGDGFLQVGFGICNVTENAFGIGVTAVPHPLTDRSWDGWMWHSIVSPLLGFSVTEGENTGAISQVRVEIDSKAMRKTRSSDLIVGVAEFSGEVGTATLQFIAETRILDKLP